MTRRSLWLVMAARSLGACLCPGHRSTETGYAEMLSYGPEIAACISHHSCETLCVDLFQIDGDAEIERCVITSLVRQDFTTQTAPISSSTDPRSLRGANVQVTYVSQVACDYGSDDGWDDGSTDDGSTDDGSTDDGSGTPASFTHRTAVAANTAPDIHHRQHRASRR